MKPITPNDANIHRHDIITAYKCTREDGTDYRTGKVRYLPGEWVTEPNADLSDAECGPGLHVSPTIRQTCGYINTYVRGKRAKFYEVAIRMEDLISCGTDKLRCVRLYVVREVPFAEAFPDCAQWPTRIKAVRADMTTWKNIPWLKPSRMVTDKDVGDLFRQWHERMMPFGQQCRDVQRTTIRPPDRAVHVTIPTHRAVWYKRLLCPVVYSGVAVTTTPQRTEHSTELCMDTPPPLSSHTYRLSPVQSRRRRRRHRQRHDLQVCVPAKALTRTTRRRRFAE
jgi:hypothetical protein